MDGLSENEFAIARQNMEMYMQLRAAQNLKTNSQKMLTVTDDLKDQLKKKNSTNSSHGRNTHETIVITSSFAIVVVYGILQMMKHLFQRSSSSSF